MGQLHSQLVQPPTVTKSETYRYGRYRLSREEAAL
jgi:cbb3-type cytochrome oxidase cytochrome c subunit